MPGELFKTHAAQTKNRPAYFVSDIDGTLLNKEGTVCGDTAHAVGQYLARGGHFAFATGRSIDECWELAAAFRPNIPCILLNGALLYDFAQERVIYHTPIPFDITDLVTQVNRISKRVAIHIYAPSRCYCVQSNAIVEKTGVMDKKTTIHCTACDIMEQASKITLTAPHDALERVQYALSKTYGLCCEFASRHYLEVTAPQSSKGTMLLQLARYCGVESGMFIAMGNGNNDVELLKRAGVALAPQNAVHEVTALADHVVKAPADAFALALSMLDGKQELTI